MKYFIVSVDDNYVTPVFHDWHGVIDRKTLHRKKVFEIQKHLLFQVENHMQLVFTDILTFPCFMVSEMVKNVIKMYNPFLKYVRVILFQKEKERSMAYYIPYLEQVIFGKQNDGRGMFMEQEKAGDKVVMEIVDGDKLHIVMRMDLVESILRRNAVGIGLKEIDVF